MKKVLLFGVIALFALVSAAVACDDGAKKGCMGKKGMEGMEHGEAGKKCGPEMCPLMGEDRDVKVTDTKDGVQVVIAAKDKSRVKELQEQVRSCVELREKTTTKKTETNESAVKEGAKESKMDGDPEEIVQCPVMGTELKKKDAVAVYEYKGKKYYLCCGMCVKSFSADPEKYIKK